MSRGNYSLGKRQREQDKQKKKKDKRRRRMDKRDEGPSEIEFVSAEEMTGSLPSIDEAMKNLQKRAQGGASATVPCKLFIGSISRTTTDQSLRAAFEEFGPVQEAVIVLDRDTGASRGFGFVTMASRKDAAKAVDAMNGADLDGRDIVVDVATER